MISNKAAAFLWDVQRAADRIVRFTQGRGVVDYVADEMMSAAIERQFMIIGEALVHLRRVAPDISAMITDLGEIVAFRNLLVHNYGAVDSNRVWGIIEGDLPRLRATVAELLRDVAPPES